MPSALNLSDGSINSWPQGCHSSASKSNYIYSLCQRKDQTTINRMTKKRIGPGQPAKGPRAKCVTAYPALLVKIPPRTKRMLEALSVSRQQPQWALVDEAIRALVARLPAAERKHIERSRSRPGGGTPGRAKLRQFKDGHLDRRGYGGRTRKQPL